MDRYSNPITPPPELVQKWIEDNDVPFSNSTLGLMLITKDRLCSIATQAARWGADQGIEACGELLDINGCPSKCIDMLRTARRPKPKSQAEEALNALDDAMIGGHIITTSTAAPTIRAALERLRELEQSDG